MEGPQYTDRQTAIPRMKKYSGTDGTSVHNDNVTGLHTRLPFSPNLDRSARDSESSVQHDVTNHVDSAPFKLPQPGIQSVELGVQPSWPKRKRARHNRKAGGSTGRREVTSRPRKQTLPVQSNRTKRCGMTFENTTRSKRQGQSSC